MYPPPPEQFSLSRPAARPPPEPGEQAFLELFAGSAGLTYAIRQLGVNTLEPLDTIGGPRFDLTRIATRRAVRLLILSGRVCGVHFGVP